MDSGAVAQQARPPTLKSAYRAAEGQREAVEKGSLNAGLANGSTYGDAVSAAIAAYEDCTRRIASLALFSTNESADDIATAHLPYLLVPYRVAELVQRLPSAGLDPSARRSMLRRARDAYERFLHHLDDYGLLATPYARQLQAYTDDPTHYSATGGALDANARRSAKIANFQAEKALRGKLDVLRQRQAERRKLQQRRRLQLRAAEATEEEAAETAAAGMTADDTAGDGHGHEDDDSEDDEDDEVARPLYLAQLAYYTHMAFQGLEGLNLEDELLAMAPAAPVGPSRLTAGGLGDSRQRQVGSGSGSGSGFSERLEQITTPGGADLRRLQSVFGSVAGAGPLLTADGKPKQPFTILGSRAERAKAVFRPGHNLPTMSIDEYLEEERRRGGIIEGGGEASGRKPYVDEDDMDAADAATMKARAWDEFTEANPRGSGNTLNKG